MYSKCILSQLFDLESDYTLLIECFRQRIFFILLKKTFLAMVHRENKRKHEERKNTQMKLKQTDAIFYTCIMN